ncbi:hypothetical protein [Conexibacter arvalis]|uniref:Prenyltransferase and squalene oxidase repeat-containing protein n=1 Tax=Conexibacter arvalis TaxID=912552 RepID=A0A840IJS1_9ACTN|nr:hypothetical protein [Conexibacter arvalis]MBB4664491.1 hypothetical protein [Conexibacter arvalis]
MPSPIDLTAAADFVWRSARLLDRHRFAALTGSAGDEPVIAALRAYQNADGGFGNALEPDLRAPVSQPQPVELAFHVLDELGALDDPIAARACDWLLSVSTAEGGVPFMLPSARAWPRAPWWETSDEPAASVNPTAALAGLLHRNGVEHPWLEPATAFVWKALDGPLDELGGYDAIALFVFLDGVPDRARAETAAARLSELVADREIVALDPAAEGHVFSPLQLAPRPDALGRRGFSDETIDRHLDALAASQQEDGGWPVSWPTQSVAAEQEWRGWLTVSVLRTLAAYGRVSLAAARG